MDKFELQSWYRCQEPPVILTGEPEPEEELDLFQEAGLYAQPEQPWSPWTPEERLPKKRRRGGIVAAVLGVAAVVGLIVGTSVFFARPNDGRGDGFADRYDGYDLYDDYYYSRVSEEKITGKNTIDRASTAPEVQLALNSAEELEPLSLDALYERCEPSVVAVRGYIGGGYTWGSGIVMTGDGYILTNTHMLDDVESVRVTLYDGSEYDAKLVGNDPVSDVAVLKIEASDLVPAQFGDSDALSVGDRVVAIGNPLSDVFTGTMTEGIVSGKERSVTYGGRTMTLLQTTAAINEGNSGGPLFNQYGQVVGITNMKMMATRTANVEGIGFAIPSTTVRDTANTLLREGKVTGRPALGVYVYEVENDGSHPAGLMVSEAVAGSDAARKGLRENDVRTEIDGQAITDFSVVSDYLAEKQVGDSVRLTIWREGKSIVKAVELIDQNDFA